MEFYIRRLPERRIHSAPAAQSLPLLPQAATTPTASWQVARVFFWLCRMALSGFSVSGLLLLRWGQVGDVYTLVLPFWERSAVNGARNQVILAALVVASYRPVLSCKQQTFSPAAGSNYTFTRDQWMCLILHTRGRVRWCHARALSEGRVRARPPQIYFCCVICNKTSNMTKRTSSKHTESMAFISRMPATGNARM